MDEVMLRNNRYKAEQSVEKVRARVREAAHAVQAFRDARHFTEEYKAERAKETVQGAYEKFTERVNDARSKTARAKERSQEKLEELRHVPDETLATRAAILRPLPSRAADDPDALVKAYLRRAPENTADRRLLEQTAQALLDAGIGAAGVPSQGGGGGRYLMAKCAAITAAGSACKGVPMPGEAYCYVHHPDTKEERRRHGSKGGRRGGRGRPSPISAELARLQAVFERLADDVLEGKQDRSAAAVAIQALNGARGCLVGALKAREQEELARELEELKSYVQDRGASRWRA